MSELVPDVSPTSDEVSCHALLKYLTDKLKDDFPSTLQDPEKFEKFVRHRIISFKTHSIGIDQQFEDVDRAIDKTLRLDAKLMKSDLLLLQHVQITRKLPLRKALMAAVQAGYSLIRIKQSLFEPIFNRYADRMTTGKLDLDNSFY